MAEQSKAADSDETISAQFDELGILAAQIERMAEESMREHTSVFLMQIHGDATAMLRGLGKLRAEVLRLPGEGKS